MEGYIENKFFLVKVNVCSLVHSVVNGYNFMIFDYKNVNSFCNDKIYSDCGETVVRNLLNKKI
jgi:hypothetical protein